MKTVCLDCKKIGINIPGNNECGNCQSKNTFLVADNVDLKEIQDSITDFFLIDEILSWIPAIIMLSIFIGIFYFWGFLIWRELRDCVFGDSTIANAPIYCHK